MLTSSITGTTHSCRLRPPCFPLHPLSLFPFLQHFPRPHLKKNNSYQKATNHLHDPDFLPHLFQQSLPLLFSLLLVFGFDGFGGVGFLHREGKTLQRMECGICCFFEGSVHSLSLERSTFSTTNILEH